MSWHIKCDRQTDRHVEALREKDAGVGVIALFFRIALRRVIPFLRSTKFLRNFSDFVADAQARPSTPYNVIDSLSYAIICFQKKACFFISFLLLFIFSFAALGGGGGWGRLRAEKSSKETKDALSLPEKVLIRLERGEFSDRDIKDLEKLVRKGEDHKAIAVLAQYYGEYADNLSEALKLLSPLLFDKKVAEEINRVCANKKATVEEMLGKIPGVSEWRKEESFACVAMARLLAMRGKTILASQGFDLVGMNTRGTPQALAAEGVGDMMYLLKRWELSVGGYEFALNCLDWMRGQSEYSDENDSIAVMEGRIRRKLERARKMWDSERYGPEFVAYRDARSAEFAGDFALAVLRYSQIIEMYPETVYAEAAGIYGPACLLNLSDEDRGKEKNNRGLSAKIAEIERRILSEKEKLKKVGKKLSERNRLQWQEQIADDEKALEGLKKLPSGKKAEESAIAQLEAFVVKNKFGLYRGEALLKLGDYFLENLEIEKAFSLYNRAVAWLENGKKVSEIVSKTFTIPVKASVITRPPEAMHSKDVWGNTSWSSIRAENVFNQNTCSWYFNWLSYGVYSKRALCYYLLGKKESAFSDLKMIIENSPYEKEMFKIGFPNSYDRLRIAFEKDGMFATKEELKAFKGKSRQAMIIAGYYYEIEDWQKAFDLFIRYREMFGKSFGKDANAYLDYVIGNLHLIRGVLEGRKDLKEKGLEILMVFSGKEYENTPTWPRGVFALSSRWQSEEGKQDDALKLLQKVAEKLPNDEYGRRAYYHQAEYLYNVLGRAEEAKAIFKNVIKRYPDTWLARGAENYLKEIEKK